MIRHCRACGEALFDQFALSYTSILTRNVSKFTKCNKCKSENAIEDINYQELYLNRDSSNYPRDNFFFLWLKKIFLGRSINILMRGISTYKTILDYGCGGGEFSNALLNKGYLNCVAADLQSERPTTLSEKISYFSTGELSRHGMFDVIVMRHVLEHFENPEYELLRLKEVIGYDGIIIIEVPNSASIWKTLLGDRWPGYFYPFHTLVFTVDGLRYLAENCSLEVVNIIKMEPPIFGVYLNSIGVPRFLSRIMSIIFYPFQVLLSRYTNRSEAIAIILRK